MGKLTTVVLAVLVLAGLAAAILLSTPESPVSPVPPVFLEFSRSEVKEVEIRNPSGQVRLERDPGDRERWRVAVGRASVRASSEKVEDLLNDLSRLAPKNFWKKAEVKPAERTSWGLEKPPVQVVLRLEGRKLEAAFGTRTLERQNVYAEKDGDGDVYVVPVAAVEPLEKAEPAALRERRPAGFSGYDAKSLSLSRADGVVLEAVKAPGGTWEVTAPFQGPADPRAIEDLVGKALGVEVADFAAEGVPDLEKFGLLRPRARVAIRREGREKPFVLLIGGDAGDGKTWFMEEGEPAVYTCGSDLPGSAEKLDPASLRDRNLLRIGWAKIDSIEYADAADPAKGWKLLRVLDRWDVERPERTPAETTLVDALLDEIRKAEVERFLDGEDPGALGIGGAGDAPARLVLTGVDEAGTRTLLLGKRDAQGKVPARVLARKGEKDPPPVLLDGAILDRLGQGWLAWRGREVLRVDLAEVVGMSRKRASGEESFLREDHLWKAAPGGPEPDGSALSAALARLLSLSASSFEARTTTGLEAWGLGDPPAEFSISLVLRKGEGEKRTRTLVFGRAAEGGGSHYARLADGDLVFRLPDTMLNGPEVVRFWDLVSSPWAKGN